jgi:hypothetical protein
MINIEFPFLGKVIFGPKGEIPNVPSTTGFAVVTMVM